MKIFEKTDSPRVKGLTAFGGFIFFIAMIVLVLVFGSLSGLIVKI